MVFKKEKTALWLVDVQEKLFPLMARSQALLHKISFVLEAAKILKLPLMVTEQHPSGLGNIIEPIRAHLPKEQKIYSKTTFSGYLDPAARQAADRLEAENWVLVGIEAHICVLQTALDLANAGKKVAVVQDAVSSRNPEDVLSAIEELRDNHIRVTTCETLIYELVRDAKSLEFKEILALVKKNA